MQSIYIFRLSLVVLIPLFYRCLLTTANIVKCNTKEKVKVLDLKKIKI
jgi:hypothetical protein